MKEFFAGNPLSRDYRHMAEKMCQPQMNKLAIIYLVYILLTAVVSAVVPSIGSVLVSVCVGVFAFSLINISKNVYLGVEVKVEDLFSGFKDFTRAICINLLVGLYTLLWSLIPFFGPVIGIIKAYDYSMAVYIALDNPNMGYNDCITKSIKMMDGHKWRLFCLGLSYFGWVLLCVLTFGVLYLWVAPKMQQASFLFYLKVSGIGYGVELEKERLERETNGIFE